MSLRFVIIGGGPAGTQAATTAARLGADVTLIERDIVGGAAHLWDCVPSKAMIATGGRLDSIEESMGMGLEVAGATVDLEAVRARIQGITARLEHQNRTLLESQGVTLVRGTGRLADAHTVVVDTGAGDADSVTGLSDTALTALREQDGLGNTWTLAGGGRGVGECANRTRRRRLDSQARRCG